MSNSRYGKFFEDVYNADFNGIQKGYKKENMEELISFPDDIIYEIPLEFQYRPDLIARKFYGNSRLFWILIYTNKINNSPEGFTMSKRIRVPRPNRILEVI